MSQGTDQIAETLDDPAEDDLNLFPPEQVDPSSLSHEPWSFPPCLALRSRGGLPASAEGGLGLLRGEGGEVVVERRGGREGARGEEVFEGGGRGVLHENAG